jgi:hypothetical protein
MTIFKKTGYKLAQKEAVFNQIASSANSFSIQIAQRLQQVSPAFLPSSVYVSTG